MLFLEPGLRQGRRTASAGMSRNEKYKILTAELDRILHPEKENNDEVYIPLNYKLHSPYPNPFNSSVKITYDVPKTSYIQIKIYDLLGRHVKSLVSSTIDAGNHSVIFNNKGLSSGIYYVQMHSDNFTQLRKIVLLK